MNFLVKEVSSILEITKGKPLGAIKNIKGWVKSLRKGKDLMFLDVVDGTCNNHLQIVCPKNIIVQPIQPGSSVDVEGTVRTTPKGQLELSADKVSVFGKLNVTDNYPFVTKQKQTLDLYRQYLHLRPHLEYFTSLFRFRSAAMLQVHKYFHENSFIGIHTPIITSNDCEGAGETFCVQPSSKHLLNDLNKNVSENSFFGSNAYLSVSGQLHLEAVTRSIAKVYTFNPAFRAENSKSRLHLNEFYMIEAEEAFVTDLSSILERIESFIKEVASYLVADYSNEIEYILKHNNSDLQEQMTFLENMIQNPFSVITFAEAKSLVKKNRNKIKLNDINSQTLTKEEEFFLVSNNNNLPIFVINWPRSNKPFYMKALEENCDLVHAVDLLVPNVGELCGGSLREDNYDVLSKKLTDLQIKEPLEWYLELRKFRNVPTGGFGMGFERLLQFLLNTQNIKDTIPFPRWPHNLQL